MQQSTGSDGYVNGWLLLAAVDGNGDDKDWWQQKRQWWQWRWHQKWWCQWQERQRQGRLQQPLAAALLVTARAIPSGSCNTMADGSKQNIKQQTSAWWCFDKNSIMMLWQWHLHNCCCTGSGNENCYSCSSIAAALLAQLGIAREENKNLKKQFTSGNSTNKPVHSRQGQQHVTMMVNCSSSCCSDGVWTNKQSDKQQSTSSNSASKTAQARQNCNGTIVIASPSWHNGGSIAAACAIQQVMVSQEHLFKNQQSTSDSSASKWEMIT